MTPIDLFVELAFELIKMAFSLAIIAGFITLAAWMISSVVVWLAGVGPMP